MVKLSRWLKHAFMPPWCWRLSFPSDVLNAIEKAVKHSEYQHSGELRFAIENALSPGWVWHGMTARHRATEIFSNLRVWDTEENSGVLIYIQLADHEVHILADRGINKCVAQPEWDRIAQLMRQEFQQGRFREGSLQGIQEITRLLAKHFPATSENINELPNRPVIIKR
ncbi:TPM domain-containing protein [Methyloglobulus sp.]|uniref:TPM domain-containing protein n=1 Tax=Methyloglobulus sp. TaxID=2518622 RepID=UPI0032B76613